MSTLLDESLLKELHREICNDLVPEWSGKWRTIEVRVGTHSPPPPHLVPIQIRDYIADLSTRIENLEDAERLPELLAFAEGRLLSIHPFADFNGRVARLWISELWRLRLRPVILAPTHPDEYLKALRAADSLDFGPLSNFWIQRLIRGE